MRDPCRQMRRLEARLLIDDDNLAGMCEACNLGLLHADGTVVPKTYAAIMFRLLQAPGTGMEATLMRTDGSLHDSWSP